MYVLIISLQCFHVPYSALTMFISSEQKERDSATAYSKSPQLFLTYSYSIIYCFYLVLYFSLTPILSYSFIELHLCF